MTFEQYKQPLHRRIAMYVHDPFNTGVFTAKVAGHDEIAATAETRAEAIAACEIILNAKLPDIVKDDEQPTIKSNTLHLKWK